MEYNYAAEQTSINFLSLQITFTQLVKVFFASGFQFGGKHHLAKVWGCCTVQFRGKQKQHFEVARINKFSESATKDSRLDQLQQKQKQKGRIIPLHVRKQQACNTCQLINQQEHSNKR